LALVLYGLVWFWYCTEKLRHLTSLFFSTALGKKVRTMNKEKLIRSLAKVYSLPEKEVRSNLRVSTE
jgi:hypothetical protein